MREAISKDLLVYHGIIQPKSAVHSACIVLHSASIRTKSCFWPLYVAARSFSASATLKFRKGNVFRASRDARDGGQRECGVARAIKYLYL